MPGSRTFKLVSLSGSPNRPSRTEGLVRAIGDALAVRLSIEHKPLALTDIGPHVLPVLTRQALSAEGEAAIASIEAADILVVGTPVYRGSYSGAFKHLFDLVRYDALAGKVVVLSATGGSPLHGLVTEHQLRPLFGFFGAYTVPTTIFATEADFTDFRLNNPGIVQRIERAASEAARLLDRNATVVPSPLTIAKTA